MSTEKSILIGCNSTVDLSALLNGLKDPQLFPHNIISVTKATDLFNISRSMTPDLVVLFFHNNQQVLNDFFSFVRKPAIPLLCITRHTDQPLSWDPVYTVLNCAAQHINNSAYFGATVNSIFLLQKDTAVSPPVTFRQQASQPSVRDNRDNLSRYVMELDQKTEVLAKVKERIAGLYPRVDDTTRSALNSIVSSIKMSANDSKIWDDFKMYFEMADPGFLLLLAKKHPELTPKDLKYCCYLKMNMSNDDIRSILGINQESVRTHKYRLKRKMALAKEDDLSAYLRSVGN